jgi:HJR/Mrr/RecB family endonuclease
MAWLESILYEFFEHAIDQHNELVAVHSARSPIEDLPQIYWEDGRPWDEANAWSLHRAAPRDIDIQTVKRTMKHLCRYAKSEKAIVFTELREVQAALSYFLHLRFAIKPFVVNGDTQSRQAYIDRFSAVEGFNVIILSTLAAGAGLNVTAANHVIHFTRAWNAAKENQATDRAYRIGQARDVFVYCPTVVGNFLTFDLRLDELLKRKGQLAGKTMSGSSMEQMLNGNVDDVKLTELMGDTSAATPQERRLVNIDDVDRLDGNSFEFFCRLLWQKLGFIAFVTQKKPGDGGVDVVALKGKDGELLQCKSSLSSAIGWDAIKEVSAGAALYQNRYAGTRFRRVCVTNQRFNAGAIEQAKANRVTLIERERLIELLREASVGTDELDEEFVRLLLSAAV